MTRLDARTIPSLRRRLAETEKRLKALEKRCDDLERWRRVHATWIHFMDEHGPKVYRLGD